MAKFTIDDAKKRASRALTTSGPNRAALEAKCGLYLSYTYASQFVQTAMGARGGQGIQQLPMQAGFNSSNIRTQNNVIRPRALKIISKLALKKLEYIAKAASRAPNDMVAAQVGDARLQIQLRDISAIRMIRLANEWRCVLGSSVLRRTMHADEGGYIVRTPDGRPSLDAAGKPRVIRNFTHAWAVCPPYEIIRDPMANDVDFSHEEIIGHEKPRTLAWLKRNYSNVSPDVADIKTKTTMGELLGFQQFLYQATNQMLDCGWMQSQEPGVMVSEWWMRDETDKPGEWPWYLMCYRNTAGVSAEEKELQPVWFGPNPFHGLPLHHLWYTRQLNYPWGNGIAAILLNNQDAVNLAHNAILRTMVLFPQKYLIQDDSLKDKISDALSATPNKPIIYKRGTDVRPPTRMPPSTLDVGAVQFMQAMPGMIDAQLNMAPVQSGFAVARGEAASAYQLRKDAADTTIASTIDDDELAINELLTGTLADVRRTDRIDALREQLSGQFTDGQIATFLEQDDEDTGIGVYVTPDSLRPKTADEVQQDMAFAIGSKMLSPDAARMSLLVKTGQSLDEREGRAYNQQILENQQLLAGVPVNAYVFQEHNAHQYAIEQESESPRFGQYSDQQRAALWAHWQNHQELKAMRAQMNSQAQVVPGPQPGQSPPPMEGQVLAQGALPAPEAGAIVQPGPAPAQFQPAAQGPQPMVPALAG